MNASPPIPSRALRTYAVVARGVLWFLAALWLLVALAWGALHVFIVPKIGELRPLLESEARRVVGVPVRIGSIEARSEGLIPSFEMREVVLLDPQGREALRLPRVLFALSPRSLWNLDLDQLYIDRPELDIRRTADGRIHVAGLDLSRGGENDGRAAEWFFRQSEFAIRGGTIRWTDETRDAPPLALADVDLVVRNQGRRHSVRLDATPPAEWGRRFSVAGIFRQPLLTLRSGRWQEWAGEIHGDFAEVDLSQLRRHADLGIRITRGRGALRAWADIDRGQVTGGTADVALVDVDAILGERLEPLGLVEVSGRLGGKRNAEGFEFEARDLQFQTREGQRWPGGNLRLAWSQPQGQGQGLPRGEIRADKVDLGALALIATRLPLSTTTHAALTAHEPNGLVENMQARWEGPLESLRSYEARGRATGLQIAARAGPLRPDGTHGAGVPGVRSASLDFEFTQAGGKARLAVADGALEFPGVFDEPVLPMQSLTGDVQWKIDGPHLAITVPNLKFANADAQGEARIAWRNGEGAKSPARLPGVIDLQASIARADGARVWRYLPRGVNKAAREYVRDSVQQGVATGAKFRVKGDLAYFPFPEDKGGEFHVTAKVQDVDFTYVPRTLQKGPLPWPALTQLSGELVFQGNGMQLKDMSGKVAGQPRLGIRADARIAQFARSVVEVTGTVRGPLADALAVVQASPASGFTNQALARARANGDATVALQMSLPLAKVEDSRVQGTVTLAGNDVQITPDSPQLARARGTVSFSEKGFQVAGGQARAYGGDIRLEGGTRALPGNDMAVQFRASGTATAEALRQSRELGIVSRLANDMTGSVPYSLVLTLRRGVPEVLITSSLQGVALNLPAPLAKAADAVLPLRYESALTREAIAAPEGSPLRQQEMLTLDLGRLASINYLRDLSTPEPRVLRGSVGVGLAANESVTMPEQGVAANINLGLLDVDAWEDVLARATGVAPVSIAPAPAPAPAPAASPLRGSAPTPAMGYLPTTLAVRAKALKVEGRSLHNIVAGGTRDAFVWRANVDADEFNGYLEYRQPAGAGAGRLHARLARLKIAAGAAGDVESLLDDVNSIPALDIVVDDFELMGRKLGRLEIDAVNRGAGTVQREGGIREWRLNKLVLTTTEATFNASGNWAAVNAQPVAPGGVRPGPRTSGERRRTAMKFQLDFADSGLLLARFGMKEVVRRGRGRLDGNLAWIGSPLSLDYPTLSGAFKVNVEAGQFLKADPGLAKLLGVLSLQSLPRRLALDFRDVFSEGFSFDFVRGDVAVEQGIATTNNLQMKGVNAAVLMDGKADIARETQDLKVVVVPEINAGTASLVATVINPAIGLGTFLAQLFLRQPLIRAATQEFHIDGTWGDPRVTKVDRSPTSSSGAAGEAAGR